MTKLDTQSVLKELAAMIERANEFKEKAEGDFEKGYENGMIRGLERAKSLIEDTEAIRQSKKKKQ